MCFSPRHPSRLVSAPLSIILKRIEIGEVVASEVTFFCLSAGIALAIGRSLVLATFKHFLGDSVEICKDGHEKFMCGKHGCEIRNFQDMVLLLRVGKLRGEQYIFTELY